MRRILKPRGRIRRPRTRRAARHTVRLRLTLLYGGLFLLAGVALLAVTYALVLRSSGGEVGTLNNAATPTGPGAQGSVQLLSGSAGGTGPSFSENDPGLGLTTTQAQAVGRQLIVGLQVQHDAMLHQFLIQSGIALGLTAALCVLLGWIAAGRILRPVRTIIATTRRVSAASLHERLRLDGPDDELKELGDTIDALLARLEATFQAQRQFIANASHELRTPLARQRVVSQVALADPEASVDSLRRAHERVLASGDQQHRLIEALLALARGQAGFSTRTPVDLAALTAAALAARREEAAGLGLSVEAELGPATVDGSAQLAERLVGNLIDNALRHNLPGGRVRVSTAMEAGRPVLTVANTGPEIPAADVIRLARPFQRLGADRIRRPGTDEGLGLGLSIVQAVAEAHGAAVDLRPRLAGGLIARVRFPAPSASRMSGTGLRIGA